MTTSFIPLKINVGFRNRTDTFTKQLAYIIYFDEKNVLRKSTSWNSWRDQSIPNQILDNTPFSGFMINKGVSRTTEWFGTGRTVVRMHDPRGFEFEISVPNLMQILMHSDVNKRDIIQECVYAWFGTELVLLPTNSEVYLNSVQFTKNKNSQIIKAKELEVGKVYGSRRNIKSKLVYLGFFPWVTIENIVVNSTIRQQYEIDDDVSRMVTVKLSKKKHIFYNIENKSTSPMLPTNLVSSDSIDVHPDTASFIQNFLHSVNGCPSVNVQPQVILDKNLREIDMIKPITPNSWICIYSKGSAPYVDGNYLEGIHITTFRKCIGISEVCRIRLVRRIYDEVTNLPIFTSSVIDDFQSMKEIVDLLMDQQYYLPQDDKQSSHVIRLTINTIHDTLSNFGFVPYTLVNDHNTKHNNIYF